MVQRAAELCNGFRQTPRVAEARDPHSRDHAALFRRYAVSHVSRKTYRSILLGIPVGKVHVPSFFPYHEQVRSDIADY